MSAGGEHTNGIVGDDLSSSFERGCCLDGFTDVGTTPSGSGLSPTVEPASSLDGSATSIPSATLWGDDGVFARFTRAAQGINRIANECREISVRQIMAREDVQRIERAAYLRGVEAAYDRARGTNADLCQSAGNAYRVVIEALNNLRHEAQAIETRSAETVGLSPQGESAVVEDHAPGA